jgi:transposase
LKDKKKKKAVQPVQETIETEIKEKRHVGRPTTYKPEYCERLIEFGKTGMSFEAFGGSIGVSRDALYDWAIKYPEFSDAKKIFTSISQHTLEYIGLEGIVGDNANFQATPWIFFMKNRCGWKDRMEVTEKPAEKMSEEEIINELKELGYEISNKKD